MCEFCVMATDSLLYHENLGDVITHAFKETHINLYLHILFLIYQYIFTTSLSCFQCAFPPIENENVIKYDKYVRTKEETLCRHSKY